MQKKLTPMELRKRRTELSRLAANRPPASGEDDEALRARFAPDTTEGRQLYESFSDETLLAVLREAARRLGRSPAQREVYWVYRAYLRTRFKNWPSALRTAGMSPAAGRGGKSLEQTEREKRELQILLDRVREKAADLGRMPHPSDLPEVRQALRRRYRTWGEVLAAAGAAEATVSAVTLLGDLEAPYRDMLSAIRVQAESLNRAPLRREVDPEVRAALVRRCGSWRNALFQVGLEPVKRMSPFANTTLEQRPELPTPRHRGTLYDCFYRLLRLDEQTRADLDLVRGTADRLGRVPSRHDVPAEVRLRLREVCGSWANAIYQVGLQPQFKQKRGGQGR